MGFVWLCSEEQKWLFSELKQEIVYFSQLEQQLGDDTYKVTVETIEKGLQVTVTETEATLAASSKETLARAFGLMAEKLYFHSYGVTTQASGFASLGLMQDCSRNSVPKVETVKAMLRKMALMGYNRMQLYTEETYEIPGQPFFGYMRGRYSTEELRTLDAYAERLGILLVPCIQTLAHLNQMFRWNTYGAVRDCNDILLCGEEKTYELIEEMVKTCRSCFRSREINIGMDEAEMLGRGKYMEKNGAQDHFSIMTAHLKRVLAICEKYDFSAMMWSDMFFKMLSGGSYNAEGLELDESIRQRIPQNVTLVYWDYYKRDEAAYDRMLKYHSQMTDRVGFAGGAWRWNGFAPLIHHSLMITPMALRSCARRGVKDIMITAWGDNGSECSTQVIWPVLCQAAEQCYTGSCEESELCNRLYTCAGMRYEDTLLLDLPNLTPDNPSPGRVSVGTAKYLLYQDLLSGLYDMHVDPDTYPKHYQETAEKLHEAAARAGEFAYLYENLACLCDALALKCTLGIRMKEAYDRKDTESLRLCMEDCQKLLGLVKRFHETLAAQWEKENKSFGFEVLDIRVGGVESRIKTAQRKLQAYLDGQLSGIEELEAERILLDTRENPPYRTLPLYHNNWAEMVSASLM